MKKTLDFPYYLSRFLAKYLPGELGCSENTVLSHRDTFSLLLRYCQLYENIIPEKMVLDRFTKELAENFLLWIENERDCSISTRNQRLAALHSFSRFMQTEDVLRMYQYQQILSIPKKKPKSSPVNYISLEGIRLILSQPDTAKSSGYRDLVLLSLMYDSGSRVQEIADLTIGDIRTDSPATLKVMGKGGKSRIIPLMAPTANLVKKYISDFGLDHSTRSKHPLFTNRSGAKLTRAGIKYILDKYVQSARIENGSVLPETISPHSFRHSKAMHLLHSGVNLIYIRDILGHADLKTTEIYARIDGEMKRKALEEAFTQTAPTEEIPIWQQDGDMLEWLKNLGKE